MTVEVERREEARAESEGATAGARARVKAIFRRKEKGDREDWKRKDGL
jgi:hypothetical protein